MLSSTLYFENSTENLKNTIGIHCTFILLSDLEKDDIPSNRIVGGLSSKQGVMSHFNYMVKSLVSK